MLNFNSMLLSSEHHERLVEFYKNVFDKKPDMEESGYAGFMVGKTFFSIGGHDKIKGVSKDPDRIILNFETSEVQKEFDRIKQIEGVKVVKEPYSMGKESDFLIATFADPDGNLFQLMSPWEEGK